MTTAAPPVATANGFDPAAVARSMVRHWPGRVGEWWIDPVDYDIGSPSTAGLFRVRGHRIEDGPTVPWSLFLKVIQSFRHWPLLHVLPPEHRAQALTGDVWRYEADVYTSDLAGRLPAGLRLPVLHRVEDLGDDRLALWLEDVATVATPCDLPRFRRAARLLGRLTARLTAGDQPPPAASTPLDGNRMWWTGRVLVAALPALRDDPTWAHPLVAATADPRLRADLADLAERVPAMLDALDRLPAIHAAILAAYTAGHADEGMPVDEELVRYGFDAALVVRGAFTALPLERLADPPTGELAALVAHRARLTRYLVDLGLSLPGTS